MDSSPISHNPTTTESDAATNTQPEAHEDDTTHFDKSGPDRGQIQLSPLNKVPREIVLLIADQLADWTDYQAFRHSCRKIFDTVGRNHALRCFEFEEKIKKVLIEFLDICLCYLGGPEGEWNIPRSYIHRLLSTAGIRLHQPLTRCPFLGHFLKPGLTPEETEWYRFCRRQNLLFGALSTLVDKERVFDIDENYDHSSIFSLWHEKLFKLAHPDPPSGTTFENTWEWQILLEDNRSREGKSTTFLNNALGLKVLFEKAYQSPTLPGIEQVDRLLKLHRIAFIQCSVASLEGLRDLMEENESESPGWFEKCVQSVVDADLQAIIDRDHHDDLSGAVRSTGDKNEPILGELYDEVVLYGTGIFMYFNMINRLISKGICGVLQAWKYPEEFPEQALKMLE
ncbi:hypothetical protein BJ508DRAFT_414795 [Ascobolus immersus RN42]|uniref:Uncharacterized protein n=1 Tax=Ascobolus immersus RN42 TaxID=1160509 RepID=A0A3N4II70_ASCIM|nr:hypothetical protein BJ508DRAFT_414795 [Ascobolus immersus RN42]